MELVDTHCHIHFKDYSLDKQEVLQNARNAGVGRIICVGTTLDDSRRAALFAAEHDNVWAAAGVHPHDAADFADDTKAQSEFRDLLKNGGFKAVGEIGLDYYKNYSSAEDQQKALRLQIEAGLPTGLPFIFHVREAWDDFWQIYDSYPVMKGVIHSFSATVKQLDEVLKRGLFVGLNGIMTFTTDHSQLTAAKQIPADRLLLETDAPFLTPNPYRGQTCQPKHVLDIAGFLADLRAENLSELSAASTKNALELFGIK